MAELPPLVSCKIQRSDRPSFQARSTAVSGASENDATAMPCTSRASTPASASAATTASRMNVWVDCPGSGRRIYADWPTPMIATLFKAPSPAIRVPAGAVIYRQITETERSVSARSPRRPRTWRAVG